MLAALKVPASATSGGSSEYSTTLTACVAPSLQKTPTGSRGCALLTTLAPAEAPWRRQKPTRSGSPTDTRALSTQYTYTHSTPRRAMSARAPEARSAGYSPPLPSGAVATWWGAAISMAPVPGSRQGRQPWSKNWMSPAWMPQLEWAPKKRSVACRVAADVMMYHGMPPPPPAGAPARRCSARRRSAWSCGGRRRGEGERMDGWSECTSRRTWNSERWDGSPMSYMPLGSGDPSRVPWPPGWTSSVEVA